MAAKKEKWEETHTVRIERMSIHTCELSWVRGPQMWLAKGDYLTCSIGGKQLRPFLPRLYHASARFGFPFFIPKCGRSFVLLLPLLVCNTGKTSCRVLQFCTLPLSTVGGCRRRSCRWEKRN
ncbi:hypothetical protein POVWA2_002450 [Plasmodium ovale wallikeri]|uniref:Uncharacterized protein n=1 Tax=Plasmodium ovale wallikeri TaxID=864142 RepID=A0A1A8YH59_PLAOA|nr:hypothetical protein POVWA1_002510 [Plasmodium ovale wallikeri]SBT31129.1 hypothetical protein POVWA2_002450 [Plasmodium ovale wallikeri]